MNTILPGGKWIVDAPSKPLYTEVKVDRESGILVVVTYEYGIVVEFAMDRNGDVTIWSHRVGEERTEHAVDGEAKA